jgi:phosphoribosylformimino-5-aminoimidazole carboxamide ribotide isomerase
LKLIPVIDLMRGLAVRAREGKRHTYRPIQSPLCASPQPEDVINAFLQLYPFDTFYIADLDAVLGAGNQSRVIQRLEKEYPRVEFWVDAGIATLSAYRLWTGQHRSRCVIGTETLADAALLEALDKNSFILSLDFKADRLLGPGVLLQHSTLWPSNVIIMTLSRVGSSRGPDYNLLAKLTGSRPEKNYYAAGGVRARGDLTRLKEMNLRGVLLASFLHEGHLVTEDIAEVIACS